MPKARSLKQSLPLTAKHKLGLDILSRLLALTFGDFCSSLKVLTEHQYGTRTQSVYPINMFHLNPVWDLPRIPHPREETSDQGERFPEAQNAAGGSYSRVLSSLHPLLFCSFKNFQFHGPWRICCIVFWACCSWGTVSSTIWSPTDPESPTLPCSLPSAPSFLNHPLDRWENSLLAGSWHQKAVPQSVPSYHIHTNIMFA